MSRGALPGGVVRRVEAGAGEPAVVLEAGLNNEEMDSGLPLPIQWGWRVTRAVFPDELHEDAPVTAAALRELRAAARPFPDVPVVVLSAARGFPRRFRPTGPTCSQGSARQPRRNSMPSST